MSLLPGCLETAASGDAEGCSWCAELQPPCCAGRLSFPEAGPAAAAEGDGWDRFEKTRCCEEGAALKPGLMPAGLSFGSVSNGLSEAGSLTAHVVVQ